MRKILFVLFLLFTFSSSASANVSDFDFSNGWFDQNPGAYTTDIPEVLDNDLSTRVSINNVYKEIVLNEEQDIQLLAFYNYANSSGSRATLNIHLFNAANELIYSIPVGLSGSPVERYVSVNLVEPLNVKYIRFRSSGTSYVGRFYLYEFELFTTGDVETVKNVSTRTTYNSITVDFEKPEDAISVEVFLDGVLVKTLTNETTYTIKNLVANTNYEISLVAKYEGGLASNSIVRNVKTDNVPNIGSFATVKDITSNSAVFNFNKSGVFKEYKSVNIYDENGVLYRKVPNYSNSFKLTNLEHQTEYTFFVEIELDDNNFTQKQKVTFTTKEESPEVRNLTARAEFDRVDLSWDLPERDDFEYARIYRKDEVKAKGFALLSFFSSSDGFNPIFETNGTFFNDLTVEPESKYDYKVTTLTNGNESEGVTISVTTPKIHVGVGDVEQDESGDYTITWDKPTTGKIKVLLGGVEYKIVNAADKKVTIPAKDMKFTLWGDPDVILIPLDESGNTIGTPTKPGSGGSGSGVIGSIGEGLKNADLTPGNLLLHGVGLLGLVGSFVLLALAFRVVPKLTNMIVKAFRGRREVS